MYVSLTIVVISLRGSASGWTSSESIPQVLAEEHNNLQYARGGTLLSAVTQLGDPQNDEIQDDVVDVVVTGRLQGQLVYGR